MPVCITGTHRSGTTLVAHVLNACGLRFCSEAGTAACPKPTPAACPDNAVFVELNARILGERGASWDLPSPISNGWQKGLKRERIKAKAICLDFSKGDPWSFRDPCTSLTLPFWTSILRNLKVVVCLRNPLEAALSLHQERGSPIALGLNLWLAYNRSVLEAARRDRRIVTHFDAYFNDPEAELFRLTSFLDLPVADEQIAQSLSKISSELRHERITSKHVLDAGLSSAVVDQYVQMCAEAGWQDDSIPRSAGARRRRPTTTRGHPVKSEPAKGKAKSLKTTGLSMRKKTATSTLSPRKVKSSARARASQRDAAILQLQSQLQAARAKDEETRCRLETVLPDLAAATRTIEELRGQLQEQSGWARRSNDAVAERDNTIRQLQAEMEEVSVWAGRSAEAIASRDEKIRQLQGQLKEQSAWARRCADELAERNAVISQLEVEAARRTELLTEVKSHFDMITKRGHEIETKLTAAIEHPPSAPLDGEAVVHENGPLLTPHDGRNGADRKVVELATTPVELRAVSNHISSYRSLLPKIREVVRSLLPPDSTVLVVNKGDEELLRLGVRKAWHFPRGDDGNYTGYYPADSSAAINHLEQLRTMGGQYLLFPQTAFWWLEHYPDFRRFLDENYHRLSDGEHCLIYHLSPREYGPQGPICPFPKTTTYDVVCFPIINWHFRFQRPQQLVNRFAEAGHRCFYFQTKFGGAGCSSEEECIAPNIFSPRLPGPESLNLYQGEIDERALEDMLNGLAELRFREGVIDAVCLVQLPFWAPLALAARKRWGWKIIYDCMDEHGGFSTNHSSMLRYEDSLIIGSDLVVATSQVLFDKMSPRARRAVLLPNAADFEHFNQPATTNPLSHLRGPVIGYYGAISDWFDVEMVRAAAAARPDWHFVLIGHTFGADINWLQQLSNVHLLGEKPYQALPSYLQRFDVACIPFLLNPLTAATNPVKFYEYLSAGKPVVAVELPDLAPYRDYFYPARDAADFIRQIETALKEHPAAEADRRMELARRNTWADRYAVLDANISRLYGKVAIVIVSYNNLSYLKLCLESLWEKTSYPNFEVIVVDNGSDAEVVQFLQSAAANEPRLKLIVNSENLGFARANNLGLAAAGKSEYLVLLNDDTVVTQGWLTKIIRYLEDPRIGLVGPVTNWAGNEAKIDVDYEDVRDMEHFAEDYMREHAGEFFDIPMLAMFCVGLRRELLDRLGPLDERYGVGMFEDDDYSLRVRQLWYRVVCAQDIFIHHWGRASFGRMDPYRYNRLFDENRRKFEEKWEREWQPHKNRKG